MCLNTNVENSFRCDISVQEGDITQPMYLL